MHKTNNSRQQLTVVFVALLFLYWYSTDNDLSEELCGRSNTTDFDNAAYFAGAAVEDTQDDEV